MSMRESSRGGVYRCGWATLAPRMYFEFLSAKLVVWSCAALSL